MITDLFLSQCVSSGEVDEIIITNKKIPVELNNFYSKVGETVEIKYKSFVFNTYENIKSEFDAHNILIKIGSVNQGMGYSVGLYYNINLLCYIFIIEGGSDYVSRANNIDILENIKEILNCYHPLYNTYFDEGYKLFNSLSAVLNEISQLASNYEDDTSFLNSSKTVGF